MAVSAQLVSIARYVPSRLVKPEDVPADPNLQGEFWIPPQERHFFAEDETPVDAGAKALQSLLEKTDVSPQKIDLILCTTMVPDSLHAATGAGVAHRVGVKAPSLDVLHACTTWIAMVGMAKAFIETGRYKAVAIVTITNWMGRLKEFSSESRQRVLGDAATATLVVAGPQPTILSVVEESRGENLGILQMNRGGPDNSLDPYWKAGGGPLRVLVGDPKRIKHEGTELVVNCANRAISEAGLTKADVNWLLTHQPNRGFIETWRELIGINKPRLFDTFDLYGNVAPGSIPITLSEMIVRNMLRRGDVVAAGTFSHGGDQGAGIVLKWLG